MRRRQYVKATAVAATAGLAGCNGILGGGGGPAGVAKDWFEAAYDGDEDKMEELTHSDSELQEFLDFFAQSAEQQDGSVDSTEVLEEGDEEARVDVTTSSEEQGEETTEVVLKTEDGDWKMWNFAEGGGGSGTSAGTGTEA